MSELTKQDIEVLDKLAKDNGFLDWENYTLARNLEAGKIERAVVLVRQETEKRCRDSLDKLDGIKILNQAIENRKTSWNNNPVAEWRNAGDEILFAVKKAFEEANNIPSQWAFLKSKKEVEQK